LLPDGWLEFDPANLIIVNHGRQRQRIALQVYKKVRDDSDFQAKLVEASIIAQCRPLRAAALSFLPRPLA